MESATENNVIDIITIVIDPATDKARLDIGALSPHYAYSMLMTAAESLYDCIPLPSVVVNNEVIMDYDLLLSDDDDEDWG